MVFFSYLMREVTTRRRQTIVVVVGMALAIAVVIVVDALSTGVQKAQDDVLDSVYGVGTDITVSQAGEPGSGGPGSFEFGAEAGTERADGSRELSRSRVTTAPGSATLAKDALGTARETDHVTGVSAALSLDNVSFSGELPDFSQGQPEISVGGEQASTGGADGQGGSAFDVDQFNVLGVDPTDTEVGPLTTISLTDGRALEASDASAKVAVLDSVYASANEIGVGDTIDVGEAKVEVVGIAESATGEGVSTGNDVYLPLQTAQKLSGLKNQVTDVYVQADSSENIDAVEASLLDALPDATVSTQADLAGDVSGSLSTASSLISRAGTWLSIAALGAAFVLATLFTVAGVGRRTREFGTLKALGWRDRRVVGQVAGESLLQGILGGLVGLGIGVFAVFVINQLDVTLSGSASASDALPAPPGVENASDAVTSAVDIALSAPISAGVIAGVIALAVAGGLLAGMFGGRRAARLSPAEALRSVS